MKKYKTLKTIMIVLNIILIPLLLLQAIGGNIDITGIGVLLTSDIIVFTSKPKSNE